MVLILCPIVLPFLNEWILPSTWMVHLVKDLYMILVTQSLASPHFYELLSEGLIDETITQNGLRHGQV